MRGVMGGTPLFNGRGVSGREARKPLVGFDGPQRAAQARFVDGVSEQIEEALTRMRARALKPFVRMHWILPCRSFTPATVLNVRLTLSASRRGGSDAGHNPALLS